MRVRLLLQILFFLALSAPAQQTVLKNFTTKNGLPSNEVYFLLSDSKGYVWVCTDAGIAKFNGNSFKSFNSSNGLPDNTIFEVKEDKSGKIWFRSFSGKTGYIHQDSVYVIGANSKIESFVSSGMVASFAIDDQGVLFLGKRNSEKTAFLKIVPPYREENTSTVWESETLKGGCEVILIGEDVVFCDTRDVLADASALVPLNLYNSNHQLLLHTSIETSLAGLFTRISRSGDHVYLLANRLLKKFDLKSRKVSERKFENDLITAVTLNKKLMIGGRGNGVKFFSEELDSLPIGQMLKGLTFTHAVPDYQGGTWYATLESGIYYQSRQKIFVEEPSPNGGKIADLLKQNDSTLLIGFQDGLLMNAVSKTGSKISYSAMNQYATGKIGFIGFVLKMNSDSVVLSGNRSSIVLNLKNRSSGELKRAKNIPLLIRDMLVLRDTLLTISIGEMNLFVENNFDSTAFTYKTEDRLGKIVLDSDKKTALLGGIRGLYQFRYQPKVTREDRILDCRVEDMDTAGGRVFIATRGLGLIIKTGARFDTINEKTGLLSNICIGVTVGGNSAWVSTNKGISKITFTGKFFRVSNFELNNFLDASSVSKLCLLGERAWFYSGSKIFSFDTLIEKSNARFYLLSLSVNDRFLLLNTIHKLHYDQSRVRIFYEALFFDCNQVNYRYKIHKNDSLWTYTNETSVNFPQLAPGEYCFVVEAKNRRGDWVKADREIIFFIEKPFWQKGWFIALEIFCAAGLILIFIRRRYNRLLAAEKSRNDLRIKMQELETRAIKAQMDPHFIFNALNSIQQFVLEGDTDNAYKYLTRFSKLVRKLLESNTNESISLEDEVDILRRYLEIEASRFEDAFSYIVELDPVLKPAHIQIPHMLIQPFVENAIWHGLLHKKEDKKLNISFKYLDEKRLYCIIEDNGVGRSFKKQNLDDRKEKKSLAMSLIQQRLELISKTRKVECGFQVADKSPGTGTVVTIIIPILNRI